MAKLSWFCLNDQHDTCKGTKLKDGLGPVEIVACKCKCHKQIKPF